MERLGLFPASPLAARRLFRPLFHPPSVPLAWAAALTDQLMSPEVNQRLRLRLRIYRSRSQLHPFPSALNASPRRLRTAAHDSGSWRAPVRSPPADQYSR